MPRLNPRQTQRIIVEIWDGISPEDALSYAARVLSRGREDNEERTYAYASMFSDGTGVAASRNKASDRLVVYKLPPVGGGER